MNDYVVGKLMIIKIKSKKSNINKKIINIKDNAQVKKGEVLFKIYDMPYKIVLINAIANLEKAKDYINSMKALYEQNLAELNKIDENIAYSKTEYQRYMELEKKSATSERALNLAQHNLDVTIKQRNIVLKQIEETKAKLDGDPSLPVNQYSYYNEALSGLSKAQLNLEHTEIKAPFLMVR